MTNLTTIMRFAAVAAVLLAGSCATPYEPGTDLVSDGAVNHPITVMPSYASLKVSFSAPQAGLMPDDAERLSAFVGDYLQHGNGAISVSAPSGPDSSAALSYFGERLAAMGVPRSRILVGTHDAVGSDSPVELGYVSYVAHTDPCGDWSENAAYTASNRTYPNFGCAVQKDIAAQIADPRDILQPRAMTAADAARRNTVIDSYEKGKVTSAEKTQDQSVKVSNVGSP